MDFTGLKSYGSPTSNEWERRAMGGTGFGGATYGVSAGLPAPVLSGVAVTPESALSFTAFFACVNVRATDLAALPLEVKRRRRQGGRVAVPRDPRYNLLFCEPNRNVSSIRFRQALYGHRLCWGNGYAEIERTRDGMPAALHLHSPRPMDTWPERSKGGNLWYQVDGGRRQVRGEDMVHVAGMGFNGTVGYSVVAFHRQAIGYGLAVEQYGAAFYGNAATPRGALKVKTRLTEEAKKNLRESVAAVHADTTNAHRLMVLEEGTEFQPFSVSPEDAQYILVRAFQAIEMCRICRVPPPRIQDYTGVAGVYKAFEDLINDYISSTLGPDAEDVEQELNRKLFTARERAHGLHVAHDFRALMRGNMAARMAYLEKRFNTGSINSDEIREGEGDNPIEGGLGKRYFVSKGLIPLDKLDDEPAAEPAPGPEPEPTPEPPAEDVVDDKGPDADAESETP